MFRGSFWSWLRRLFFGKPAPLTGGRRSRRRSGTHLGVEFLEDRTVPAATLAVNQAFVSTAYQALLGRNADSGSLSYWSGMLTSGSSPTGVASAILNSTEFGNDQVMNLYQSLLRHGANSGEMAYWVGQNQNGVSWEQVEAKILGSNEYYQSAGGTTTSYVSQLFQDVLHRQAASSELPFFQQQVAAGVPLSSVALEVVNSTEAVNLQVQNDYSTILGVNPASDPSGVQYWTNQIQQGVSRTTVLAGFLGSAEFTGEINQYITQNSSTSANGFGAAFIGQTGKFGMDGAVLSESSSNGALANVGLALIPNVGQTSAAAQYIAQGAGYTAFLTPTGPVLSMNTYGPVATTSSSTPHVVPDSSSAQVANSPTPTGEVSLGMTLLGGNANATPVAQNQLASATNYFIGPQSDWMTNVANYGAVRYQSVYNGVDVVYQGAGQNLEYQFVVNPGASVNEIALTFPGWQASVAPDGSLVLYQPQANVTMYQAAPNIYQANGVPVYGGFVNLGGGKIGFQVGNYDHNQALTIDPTLDYSTFVGGAAGEPPGAADGPVGVSIAVDGSGDAYVASCTDSTNFPTTPGSFAAPDPTLSSSAIVVFKLNPTGTGLLYSTYLSDSGTGAVGAVIAIDSSGDAYVAGMSVNEGLGSNQYPTTAGAYKTTPPSVFNNSVVVTELNPAGNGLVYSTYVFGGGTSDSVNGIALDPAGGVYLTGSAGWSAGSLDLPTTAGAFQTTSSSLVQNVNNSYGYVLKLSPNGSTLDYATFLTGSAGSIGNAITVDGAGDAYVGGQTGATDFPTTSGAFQTTLQGSTDGFISILNPSGSGLLASTYLGTTVVGSSKGTYVSGIALDSTGAIYVVGTTPSGTFPTTSGAYQSTYPGATGATEIFVTKMNSTCTSLVWSTYVGCNQGDSGAAIALDSLGDVYVTGTTATNGYPTMNPIQGPDSNSSNDAIVAVLDPTGSTLLFSTNFGGLGNDQGYAIGLDSSANIYIAGSTTSDTSGGPSGGFTSTAGALQPANAGGTDLFVAKISAVTTVPPPPPPGGGGTGGGTGGSGSSSSPPYQTIVSTSDNYGPNQTSDRAHDFGSLGTVTIFTYENLDITNQENGGYEWYKWEASGAGTFYSTLDTTTGGPLEMHLFEDNNGVLTQLSSNTGGTLETNVTQGQTVYVEVKGVATSVNTKTTGTYNLDVALEPPS